MSDFTYVLGFAFGLGLIILGVTARSQSSTPNDTNNVNLVNINGKTKTEVYSHPDYKVVIVDGVVVECRKNGKDLDPESDEAKALIESGRAEHAAGMKKLDEEMKKIDENMRQMEEDLNRRFAR